MFLKSDEYLESNLGEDIDIHEAINGECKV